MTSIINHKPTVSVIIPCYNQGQFVDDAVQSVLNQTYQDFEIIIVNDGSTDQVTTDILAHYQPSKTTIINTNNQGLANARNNGIKAAYGTYILPLDADDKIANTYMEKAVNLLENHQNLGIVYCEAEFFGNQTGKWLLPEYKFPEILQGNMIFCAGFFRRSDWEKIGGYDPKFIHGWEDYDFWLSMIELGREVLRIPEVLFFYRQHSVSMAKSINSEKEVYSYCQLFNNHPQLYHHNMQIIFKHIVDLRQHITDLQQQFELERSQFKQESDRLQQESDRLQQESDRLNTEIREITNSRTWKVLQSLKNNQLIYLGGHLLLNILQTAKKIFSLPQNILEKTKTKPEPKI